MWTYPDELGYAERRQATERILRLVFLGVLSTIVDDLADLDDFAEQIQIE